MTTTPSFTKEIQYCRFTKDYSAKVDGNLIGFFGTHREAEIAADEYVFNLLSDGLHIPATALDGICGDCGATLDNQGLCGCQVEEPAPHYTDERRRDLAHRAFCGQLPVFDQYITDQIGDTGHTLAEMSRVLLAADDQTIEELVALSGCDHTRPAPLSCSICAAPALCLEPHGAFCAGCWEAQGLWQLWKRDSTTFVWSLRQQRARLQEMAERLATYLSKKHSACLSCDSVLTMWRQLLDGDPSEPRYYVVATRQPVAA